MRYRTTTLLARQNLGTAGTHIMDIPIHDIISAFRFHLEIQSVGAPHLAHGFDAVPKVEIVDGSDVLLELSMAQMDALHFYERRQLGNIWTGEYVPVAELPDEFFTAVYFGRWAYDEMYALDPGRFSNPQMRITFNAALYDALAVDLFMTVYADVFDEYRPSPVGFLQNREFYRYTPVANAFHYVNLPTDLVLRKLILQAHQYTKQPNASIAEARLDERTSHHMPTCQSKQQ